MSNLLDLCALVRSKNAGPFVLTFDFVAKSSDAYARLVASEALTPELFAKIFHVRPDQVEVSHVPLALAMKVSMPRPTVQGSLADSDAYAGQQYGPLMSMTLEEMRG